MRPIADLVDDYVAAWNELIAERRHGALRRLYASDSRVVTANSDSRGIDEVVKHVDDVVAAFIGPDKHRFREAGTASHHDCVLLRWEMVTHPFQRELHLGRGNELADWGINTLVLDTDGRIATDLQFVAPPQSRS
jgi:hypothetical protein